MLPRLTEVTDPSAPQTADELTDPRYELVQKLLEYKRFKDTAMLLERKAIVHSQRFPRYPARLEADAPSDEPPPLDMEEVQIDRVGVKRAPNRPAAIRQSLSLGASHEAARLTLTDDPHNQVPRTKALPALWPLGPPA